MRATDSLLGNSPDGWVSNQDGPIWFMGSDQGMPEPPNWTAYGYHRHAGRYGSNQAYRSRPVSAEQLAGRGILPSITRATNLIVGPVVGTTWRYYAGSALDLSDVRQGTEVQSRPLWTVDPQLVGRLPGGEDPYVRPTVPRPLRISAHAFWETLAAHALWWGKGALMYAEGSGGAPLAGTLRIANPAMWGWTDDGRFVLDPDGDDPLESDYDGGFDVGPVRWCMRLLDGWAPVDGETASGVLPRSGLVVTTGERTNSYLASVMGSGVPAGVLKVSTPDFNQDKADALKRRWMQAHGGVRKSVAVLSAGVDFSPLQLKPVDADVAATKGSWLVEVAHAFGLAAADLDAATGTGGNITYANLGERRRARLDDTLAIPGRRMEDFISSLLPYGTSMRVDWTGYLSTDAREQVEFVERTQAMGLASPAEGRDRLSLRPRADVPDTIKPAQQQQPEQGQEGAAS